MCANADIEVTRSGANIWRGFDNNLQPFYKHGGLIQFREFAGDFFSNTRCWWFSWIGRWGEASSSFSAVWGFVVSISLWLLEKLEGHHIKGFQETLWSSVRRSSWHLLKIFPKSGSRLFILSVSKQRESFLVCGNLYFCCLTQMLDSIFKYSLHLGGSLAGFLSVPVEASGYTSSSKLASRSTSSDGSSSLK